jgi:DNA-binding beta-propeller fold protein YncE
VGSGTLTPLSGSPFPAGNEPSAITIDAAGKWVYVANSLDSTVTAYSLISGALTRNTTYAVGTQPVAIGIDPSLNEYLYTANFLGNTVTGFQLSATDGSLLNSQDSPYPSNAQPTAVAAIPHGSQKK